MRIPCIVLLLALLYAGTSCVQSHLAAPDAALQKITFELAGLDADGLRGPPDGRRSLSYEFCIPNTPERIAEVGSIDPTVQFMPASRGRIGCGRTQCLCIGSTHQKGFRHVLERLAALPYIERIDECFFE